MKMRFGPLGDYIKKHAREATVWQRCLRKLNATTTPMLECPIESVCGRDMLKVFELADQLLKKCTDMRMDKCEAIADTALDQMAVYYFG